MVVRTYAIESLLYRTAGLIDARIAATPHDATDGSAALAAFEEYAVEASIAKVAGSEALELRPRREHPDSRRQRLRARLSGRAPLPRRARQPHLRRHQRDQPAADSRACWSGARSRATCRSSRRRRRCRTSCSGRRRCRRPTTALLADERRAVEAFKKTALMVFGLAMQTYGAEADRRAGSADAPGRHRDRRLQRRKRGAARARPRPSSKAPRAALHVDAARVFVNDAAMRIDASARQALAAMVDGDTLRTMLAALRRLLKVTPINTVGAAAPARGRNGRARRVSARVVGQVGR